MVDGAASGPYNVAAEPVLDGAALGRLLGARPVPVPHRVLRGAVALTWRLRLQPTDPGWVDLMLRTPLLDTTRIREELGWEATRSSEDALAEVLGGIEDGAGGLTPPLDPAESGPMRVNEVTTGVGARAQP